MAPFKCSLEDFCGDQSAVFRSESLGERFCVAFGIALICTLVSSVFKSRRCSSFWNDVFDALA